MIESGNFLILVLLGAYAVFVWWIWHDRAWMSSSRLAASHPRREPLEDQRERVLFVCTHNSARSQIAEALLRSIASRRFLVASAGTMPTQLHPLAMQVLMERGLSLVSHRVKSLADVGTRWDYVITVCDDAYEKCPDFPAKTSRLHWSIADPSRTGDVGSDEQVEAFRRVRDELAERISRWVVDRAEKP
jgi:arsenate reductase